MFLPKFFKRAAICFTLFAAFSCATDRSEYGRVELYNAGDNNSFVFAVSEEFVQQNKNSPADKINPKLNEAEASLLISLLAERGFCLDEEGDPAFIITSRQEKIYDATFAHLIEENYQARPLAPRMYFGKCKKLAAQQ